MSFEANLQRLEAIVAELECGEQPLERALALFEEGIGHLRAAAAELARADERVAYLREVGEGLFELDERRG